MGRPDPQVWDGMLSYLRDTHPGMCRHWFEDIEPLNLAGGTLKLLVREQVHLKYLQRCCTDQFTEAAQTVTSSLLGVSFVGEADAVEPADESPRPRSVKTPSMNGMPLGVDEVLISPDYSFQNFIIGPTNELAYKAATCVSEQLGRAYNPLFIYGGVGLGKTHLLQAICQEALRRDRSCRLHYVSCDGFITAFNEAVQRNEMAEFRQRFRTVDLLVVDDIHDLAKRDRTQEEFFHTFNSLYQAGKQIVLSSDASPKEIPDLEERLTSRFNSGLVAEISRPGYETRVSIVRTKAELRNLPLSEEVAGYIAAKIDTNIRELEGAITKIQGLAQLTGQQIDLDLAKKAIGEHVGPSPSQHPSIQTIIDAVTRYYDVKLTDLLSKRRHKSIAQPRQVGMWLARKFTRYSLEEIGGYFGGRDHTTVMHAVKAIESKRSRDNMLDQDVHRLEEQLGRNRSTAEATA